MTMKKINLVFTSAGNKEYTLTLADPKEDLTLEECQTAAAKLLPVLLTHSGEDLSAFKRAVLVTTTEQELA